jgi:hypothetical protein
MNSTTIQVPLAPGTELPENDAPPPNPIPETEPTSPRLSGACRDNRPNGKIARLPKTVRDQINHWLLDGVSYPDIIQRLGDCGKDLTLDNLSQWKKRAHQQWLVEQAFIERTRARQETPGDLVRGFDATEVNHAALQLGALQIFEALRDLGPGSLNDKLGGDSAAFVRLLNALARTSRETMMLQKYREACARARAALQPMKDPKRKLSDDERHHLILQVDEILGLPTDSPEAEAGNTEFSATTPPSP